MFRKGLIVLTACYFAQSCTKIDDYMLGKDNTPKPQALAPIKQKVAIKDNWVAPVGKASGSNQYLKLKPVVKNNVVYTADASGVVQAIDKNTAKPIWSRQLKQGIVSGPTVKNGKVAVGTDQATVVLLKQSDGETLWTASVSGDALSKTVIADKKVLVKTIDGHLYGFNAANGQKEWVADHGAPNLILKASSAPVVLDGLAIVGFSDGKLDAIDLNTGSLLWQRGIAYASGSSDVERLVDIDADPVVRGSVAYLATYQGYVGAFSLVDGQFIWRKPASTYKNIAVGNDALYLADSDDVIWAYDLKNGRVRWKQTALKGRSLT
jgi:outer membrane protein assembly factor BamB